MLSNIYLKNSSLTQTFNLNNNQKVNIYLVANDSLDINKDVNLFLKNHNEVNIYCLVLASAVNKSININIHHDGNESTSNIYVKSLVNNGANVKINCISSCKSKTSKNIINQNIDGLIFDDKSSIHALPCLDINIDDIVAKHTVNIGQVDPEIIFYLNTKGLSKLDAYQFLIDSFINDLKPYLTEFKIDINKSIKSLMGGHYE